jgi:hypothetical protein
MLSYDPVPVLQSAGYTEREAAFLYLVALHSGYFLRRQYDRFIQRSRGALAEQLLRKAAALGHLQSLACGQARFVYHLAGKEIYDAAGLAASQHRRLKGDAEIKRRLMVLDFVLDHLADLLLDSAEAKVAFLTGFMGLSEALLPQTDRGSFRFFSEEFPILAGDPQRPGFTFFDEGALSTSAFESFLRRYRAFFTALPGFDLLYLAGSDQNFERAGRIFATLFPEAHALGVTSRTPRGVDHFLAYLRAREISDTQRLPLSLGDLDVLHEGDPMYTTLEHQALCAAWKMGTTTEEKIRRRFHQSGPQAKFTAIAMPYPYPIYRLKRERREQPELGSSERSSGLLLSGAQAHANPSVRKGGA